MEWLDKLGKNTFKSIKREDYENDEIYNQFWKIDSDSWAKQIEKGYPFPKERIREILKDINYDTVLDFGCHQGHLYEWYFQGKDYLGVDIIQGNIDIAIEKYKAAGGNFKVISSVPTEWQLADSYDLIFCEAVLVHIPPKHFDTLIEKLLNLGKTCLFIEADVAKIRSKTSYCYDRNYRKIFSLCKYINLEGSVLSAYLVKR